jgi:hypothetical protein
MDFRKVRDKRRYDFVDAACIGRACWAPGLYQHRSALAGGGSRNTGSPDTPCCLNRAYHGCPIGQPQHTFVATLAKTRRDEGWKRA